MVLRTATKPPYTVADLDHSPDDGCRYELIEGDLHVSAAPFKLGILLEEHWARAVAGVNDHGYGEVLKEISARLIAEVGERARGERPLL